jgi:hypothetical protein
MGEVNRFEDDAHELPALASIESFENSMQEWSKNPTGNDPMIAHFASVSMEFVKSNRDFRNIIIDTVAIRNSLKKPDEPLLDADYLRNLLLRDFCFQFISMDKLSKAGVGHYKEHPFLYPDEVFTTREGWHDAMQRVLVERYEELTGILYYEKIVSNVSDRYKADKIIFPRFEYRLKDKPIRKLDVGPSIGLGPKKLLLNEPFSEVTAIMEDYQYPELDHRLTEGVNGNISPSKKINFEKIVGFDSTVSANHRERVRAHSFYPGEYYEYSKPHDAINNPNRLDEFNRLADEDVPDYETFRGDFTSRDDIERFKKENPGVKFHNISFYTVAYMFSVPELSAALTHSYELLEPDGFIFLADRVNADPNYPNGLNFGKHWNKEWVYSGTVIDPSEGGEPHTIFRWRTPRCRELMFTVSKRD